MTSYRNLKYILKFKGVNYVAILEILLTRGKKSFAHEYHCWITPRKPVNVYRAKKTPHQCHTPDYHNKSDGDDDEDDDDDDDDEDDDDDDSDDNVDIFTISSHEHCYDYDDDDHHHHHHQQ